MKTPVHIEIAGEQVYVGQLFHQFARGKETSSFEYSAEYLNHPHAYKISPELELYSGPQPGYGALPAAFSDSAPDRWGRNLIAKAIREQEPLRRLTELDYLLGVSDETRIGAFTFDVTPSELVGSLAEIPPLVELPRLLAASRLPEEGELFAVKELLGAGSASLGGARPKAQVRQGDDLWIAKFPHKSDEWDVLAFEKLALTLAAAMGIAVPETKLLRIDGSSVLLSKRFDRRGNCRIGYQSFMTALLKRDGEPADYLEIAEELSLISTMPSRDLQELFRRIALSVAIRNTDDHLRNHGLIRSGSGWALSPVFDVNPTPISEGSLRATSIAGAVGTENEIAALVEHCGYFDLSRSQARQILLELSAALDSTAAMGEELDIPQASLRPFLEVFGDSQKLIAAI